MEAFFWKSLTLAWVLSVSGRPHLPHDPLSYEEALGLGVEIFNKKAGEGSLYRLLESLPQPGWDPVSESNQALNFTIKETACRAEEDFSADHCDFKEDGMVRQCTGYYFLEERPPVAVLTCHTVGRTMKEEEQEEQEEQEKKDQSKRVKRVAGFWQDLGDGLRDFLRNHDFVFGVNFRF